MHRSLLVRLSVASVLGAWLMGCRDPVAPVSPAYVRVLPEWVTGAAASGLDTATGRFRLPQPTPRYTSLSAAESLAVALTRHFAYNDIFGTVRPVLERDRGGPVDLAHLRPCARATYVESPHGEISQQAPDRLRRSFGPHWAIPLCARDGTAHVSIGIPDAPLDLYLDGGSIVFRPGGTSGNFNVAGVPARYPFGLPVTPEEAVAVVVKATGVRVISVPVPFNQLDARHLLNQLPLCASWRVEVEHPVSVRTTSGEQLMQVQEFFVRRAPGCFLEGIVLYAAAPEQPTNRWLAFPKQDSSRSAGLDSVNVALIGPTVFEHVVVHK